MARIDNLVTEAKELFKLEEDSWSEIYRKAKDDMVFLSDDPEAQWDAKDYSRRIRTGRPALTIDQLGQFVRQVTNDVRMNTPSIKAVPIGDGADIETAEVIQGLIRHIQYKSKADSAYDTAVFNSTRCSIGWLIVDHKVIDEAANVQELCIKRVVDPLSVWIDSCSVESDGSDARHAFVLTQISKSEFKRLYKGFDPVCFKSNTNGFAGLFKNDNKDTLFIAEYYKVEETEENDGERSYKKRIIRRYKLSGQDTLEETIFPGDYIPVVPVYGEEAWVGGKRKLNSLIRKSKQAQQMYNYWKSLETELLMKQPQAPVMAAVGQVEDFSEEWGDPAQALVLRYKQVDAQGNLAPAPQRLAPPQIPTGVVNASRQSVDDIKATMGLYNASIGARSNETSGVAIQRRQQEGDVATYHYGDNLTKAVQQVGCILLSAIPTVYDSARILQIIGEEDDVKSVGVNGEIADGQERTFDLTRGEYMVRITTDAPFTTKRQESAEFFTEIVTRQPQLMDVAGDLLFKYMDFPGSQALASRMRKLIDPKLLEEDGQEQDPMVAQLQMALQQAQAQIEQLAQVAEGKQAEVDLKAQEAAAGVETDRMKLSIEEQKLELDRYKIDIDAALKQEELALKRIELGIKQQEADNNEIQQEISSLADELADEIGESQSLADDGNETLTNGEIYG